MVTVRPEVMDYGAAENRHLGQVNMLYVDGHVGTHDSDWVNFEAGPRHWNKDAGTLYPDLYWP